MRILDSLDPQVHDGVPGYLATDAELVVGDVRDRAVVDRCLADADALVHLAAAVGVGQSMYEIERYTSVNAIGAAVVLEAAIAARDRLTKAVVASSMSIYGEGLYRCPADGTEVAPSPRAGSPARASASGRSRARRAARCSSRCRRRSRSRCSRPRSTRSTSATTRRCSSPGAAPTGCPRLRSASSTSTGRARRSRIPYTGVGAIFASRLLNGRPPVIFEDGRQSRDFIHVSDIAAGIEAALDPAQRRRRRGQPRHRAERLACSTSPTCSPTGSASNIEPEILGDYRAGDIRHCFGSIDRARELLGFAPEVVFEDGMRELSGWLAGQTAVDRVDEATAALRSRGLAR